MPRGKYKKTNTTYKTLQFERPDGFRFAKAYLLSNTSRDYSQEILKLGDNIFPKDKSNDVSRCPLNISSLYFYKNS